MADAPQVVSEAEDFNSLESSLSRLGADLLVRILSDLSSSQVSSFFDEVMRANPIEGEIYFSRF